MAHAYLLLLATAFGGQAALFVPVVPVLISAGVLAARGDVNLAAAIACVFVGVVAGDFLWYRIGRRNGRRILSRICRRAIEPDTCVRRTQNLYGRYGARTLLFAKFIPGLSTIALPLAGVFGMRLRRFVLYDAVGVLLWSGAYAIVGYVSARQLMEAAVPSPRRWQFVVAALVVTVLYFGWKVARRQAWLHDVRIDRIDSRELKYKIDTDAPITVLDLRHPIDVESDPWTVPGALYIPVEELGRRYHELPRDREVALFCTCPDEVTSAHEAVRLRAKGFDRVRPLKGGLTAWRERGYPVAALGPEVPEDQRIVNVL